MSGKSVSRFSQLDADELLALSKFDIDSGRLDEALLKLKPLINDTQPTAEAISTAARLYAQLRMFDRAELLFRQYVELDSEDIDGLFQLGMSLYDGGKPEEAMGVWDKVLERQPAYPPALFFKGLAFANKGEVDAASELLEEIVRSVPNDNLYFSRAHDLLRDLGSTQSEHSETQEIDSMAKMDENAYKVIQ